MKYLVSYSGGLGSFYAAKLLVDKYGSKNVVAVFMDVGWEDLELYKFIDITIKKLGIDLIILSSPYTPKELSKKQGFIFNSRVSNCSMILKNRLLNAFLTQKDYVVLREKFTYKNFIIKGHKYYGTLKDATLVLGIDWTEFERCAPVIKGWGEKGFKCEFPLVDDLTYNKQMVIAYLERNGIELPTMYKLGFAHFNCGGRCFRAGQRHYLRLYECYPDRFEEMKQFEEDMGTGHTILKKVVNGKRENYSLKDFEKVIKKYQKQINIFELMDEICHDEGGCACGTDMDESEKGEEYALANKI